MVAADSARSDGHTLNQGVRVTHNGGDVLAGARLRLVSVNHQVTRLTVRGGQEGPLQTGGEACTTTAAQAGSLNQLNDFAGLHFLGLS